MASTKQTFDAYEAKVFEVAVTHAESGGARNCEQCPKGQYLSGKSNVAKVCKPCGKGKQAHNLGQSCAACPKNHFNRLEEGKCHPCGNNTVAVDDQTGCIDQKQCRFTGKNTNLHYDLNGFSPGKAEPVDAGTERGVAYSLNLCHDSASTENRCLDSNNQSLPYRACMQPSDRKVDAVDLGRYIGYGELERGHLQFEFEDPQSECVEYTWRAPTKRRALVELLCADVGLGKC